MGRAPRISPPDALAPEYVRLLLAIRWSRHWTQAQLADALGVHPNTVARWERGEHEPHPALLPTLRRLVRRPHGGHG